MLADVKVLEKIKLLRKLYVRQKKKRGAVIGAVLCCLFMSLILGTLLYFMISGMAPVFPLLIPATIILITICGTVAVLVMRIRQINSGEEYEARKY